MKEGPNVHRLRWKDEELERLRLYLESPHSIFARPRRFAEIDVEEKEEIALFIESSMDMSFSDALLKIIDIKGFTDVEVYKNAKVDRRVFSKIRSSSSYQPSINTAIRLCLGLKATPLEALMLLEKAGYTLSRSKKEDLVVLYCLEHKIYDVDDINLAIELLGLEKKI
ncbi:MAG: XRE family transcriptional regulator [Bacilli bacterium]|nr:XRE family transcriptional regulator [Bacilli bacterium]